MNLKTQKKFVAIVVTLLSVWPAFHLLMAHTAFTSPWRFLGFAMYTTPHSISVIIRAEFTDGKTVVMEPEQMPSAVRKAFEDFEKARRTFGRLYSPKSFMTELIKEFPDIVRLEMKVETYRLKDSQTRLVDIENVSLLNELFFETDLDLKGLLQNSFSL